MSLTLIYPLGMYIKMLIKQSPVLPIKVLALVLIKLRSIVHCSISIVPMKF